MLRKKILVIGSAVADVIINLNHLPTHAKDVHITKQTFSLGGCALNAAYAMKLFGADYDLFAPVGKGAYGQFIETKLKEKGMTTICPSPMEENGCCYCYVEEDGERTFLSYHGAEYRFYKEWFDTLNTDSYDMVYICGLEIEESTGDCIIEFLEKNPQLTVFFAPGPRLTRITKERMERIFKLRPIIHLNDSEVCDYSRQQDVKHAAKILAEKTQNDIIVTLGEKGCFVLTNNEFLEFPGQKAHQIDTIGAGDGHIGALMSRLALGDSYAQALPTANIYSAAIVETPGALLPAEAFKKLVF